MTARAFLEGLTGAEAVVVAGEDGKLVDAAGTSSAPDALASVTSALALALGQLAGALHLGEGKPFTCTIRGQSGARVICRQRGAVAVVDIDPRRPTVDLESRLRAFDWSSAAARPVSIERHDPKFAGALQLFGLPDLLEFLRAGRRTGRLVCTSAAGEATVCLRCGKIVGATSPTAPTVASFFVQRGLLSADDLRASPLSDPAIARILLDRGTAVPDDVRAALLVETTGAVRELVGWGSGSFTFEPESAIDAPVPGVDFEIDPQALLLSIFAHDDETARAR